MKKTTLATSAAVLLLAGCATTTPRSTAESSTSTTTTTTSSSSSSSTTTDETPAPSYTPTPADFKITLKIRKKECFGSAGCNVVYQIKPEYVGSEDISTGSFDITYEVLGGEDGPNINTFSLQDGQASFDEEEMVSTSSKSKKLTAKVTDVSAQ